MSFYLSNADTGPTGLEPVEFLDAPDLPAHTGGPFVPVETASPSLAGAATSGAAPDEPGPSTGPVRQVRKGRRRIRKTWWFDRRRSTVPETGGR